MVFGHVPVGPLKPFPIVMLRLCVRSKTSSCICESLFMIAAAPPLSGAAAASVPPVESTVILPFFGDCLVPCTPYGTVHTVHYVTNNGSFDRAKSDHF